MITNINTTRVLCFGDSNTWGRTPDRTARYANNVRWPGALQDLLGIGYDVIEEGQGGRTVNLDYASENGRNGKTYLSPCLESHSPLDAVIIMLGTNDLKKCFNSTPDSIAEGLSGLIEDVHAKSSKLNGEKPKIIIISPVIIEPDAPRFMEFYSKDFDVSSGETSKQLAPAIKAMCDAKNVTFVDGAKYTKVGEDGLHFDGVSNLRLAEALKELVA